MHVFRPRTDLGRCLLALAPLLAAALIAISRLADYRHDVYDVTCGSLLGMLVAYFSYRRYYPVLRYAQCDTPYNKVSDGFGKLPGDEEQAQARELISHHSGLEESYHLGESSRGT